MQPVFRPILFLACLGLVVTVACAPTSAARPTEAVPVKEATAVSLSPRPPMPTQPARQVGSQVGQQAPPFALETLDGNRLTSADLVAEGKPFVVYSFATW